MSLRMGKKGAYAIAALVLLAASAFIIMRIARQEKGTASTASDASVPKANVTGSDSSSSQDEVADIKSKEEASKAVSDMDDLAGSLENND